MDPRKPDSASIRSMFDHLADRYDVFNRLASLGLDNAWRREALAAVKPGMRVLDIGCGTGDLALEASRAAGPEGEVVGLDFSDAMLRVARKRYEKLPQASSAPLRLVLKKAEELPLDSTRFDVVLSGFVLRNIYENIDSILRGVHGSLKPGGRISFLDLTEPESAAKKAVWKAYMRTVVALFGKALFGKHYPAAYLTDSAERFLKPEEFVRHLERAGFSDIETRRFMMGVIVLYRAVKGTVPGDSPGDCPRPGSKG